jgi:hypothetical protein
MLELDYVSQVFMPLLNLLRRITELDYHRQVRKHVQQNSCMRVTGLAETADALKHRHPAHFFLVVLTLA